MLRILAILLIFAISFGLAFGLDRLLNKVEENEHPLKYGEYVEKYAKEYNLPEYFIYGIIKVESNFDPLAKSSAGALGLMQMMPSTFEELTSSKHLGEGLSTEALYSPDVSIRYGTYYFMYLYRKFDYDLHTALAAYNAGPGTVSSWLKDEEYLDENGRLTHIPYPETRSYVKKVDAAIATYKELYYTESETVLA